MSRWRGALLTCTLAFACRQIAGIDDRQPSVDSGSTCGAFSYAIPSCGTCTEANCCVAAASCRASSASCAAAFACLVHCSEAAGAACRTSCRASFPTGFDDALAAITSCQVQACAFECRMDCGGYAHAFDGCGSCSDSKCCTESTDCAGDAECLALAFCERRCKADDAACSDDCRLAHPEGVTHGAAFSTCITDLCADDCSAWACLGKVPGAKPSGGTVALAVLVRDAAGNPIAGASARACARSDLDCAQPVAGPATSDSTGLATFWQGVPSGFDGYVEISSASLLPTLVFTESPVVVGVGIEVVQLASADLDAISAVVGPLDPTRGHVLSFVTDCTRSLASGVTLSLTPADGAKPFNFQGELASATATSTDSSGAAGFLDVAVGKTLSVSAKVANTGQPIAARTLFARAGSISIQPLAPAP